MRLKKALIAALLAVLAVMACAVFAFADDSVYEEKRIVVSGQNVSDIAYTIKGSVYISVDAFKAWGDNSRFVIDEDNARINIDVSKLDAFYGDAETTEFIKSNAGVCYVPIKSFKDGRWVSLNVMAELAGLSYSLENDTVYIVSKTAEGLGVITEDTEGASLSGNVSLSEGIAAYFEGETASFYKVRTLDGSRLYVAKTAFRTKAEGSELPAINYAAKKKADYSESMINLAWVSASATGVTPLAPEKGMGIDVLSPRWFDQAVNGDGEVVNNGDKGYVRLAHEHGYSVWACVTNLYTSTGSTKYTSSVLDNEQLADGIIAKYLFYSCLYDVDGINVDYEDLVSGDREGFTDFMRTLGYYCGRLGLYSSVDIPGEAGYAQFDYSALGKACDYVVVMSYDYYYSGSTYAGPVSGYSNYFKGIRNLISYVGDSKRMLMGVPLYAALWSTDSNNKKVRYSIYRISALKKLVADNNAVPVWDESAGQYYAQWQSGSYISKIWLEDMRSLAVRIAAARELGLGGTACWQMSYAESSDFDIFHQVYKAGVDPATVTPPFN
ncbi:MAG: hypothetical protein IKR08_06990 [Firmicutes bacterium]|nr:hypothetical protein [Bacillota bacterium]